MNDPRHLRLVEALLFASAEPLHEQELAGRLPPEAEIRPLLEELQAHYQGRGVNLVRRDNRWAFRTAPDLGALLVVETTAERKLSRAAVETLAVIAYHQPVTRAEIEEIRGVALSKGTLDALFEAGWVRPRGRRRSPGKPMQWGTSEGFLDHFGLESIEDLPGLEELKGAGLLDARPLLSSYGNRASEAGEPEDVEETEELDEEELERQVLERLKTGGGSTTSD